MSVVAYGVYLIADGVLSLDAPPEVTHDGAIQTLNEDLLPAMKEVGDKFGSGELILPFVLKSAECMKAAVGELEKYLVKEEGSSKGKLVLGTVYGDVHDIGKNLVKTIFQNNGYTVYDLGKQVPLQKFSLPRFEDVNQKIAHECYIKQVINKHKTLDYLSFNFGPTLLRWIENAHPPLYKQILEADKLSCERFEGHGNAIAQGYNHTILPLANEKDLHTQIHWGIEDFQFRYNRYPGCVSAPR